MIRIALGVIVVCLLAAPAAAQNVSGYYRNNGTYVAPYARSAPDGSYNNNYEVKPNVNPYSGKEGTLPPTYNDRPPAKGGLFDKF
jgi:hypothetical protein